MLAIATIVREGITPAWAGNRTPDLLGGNECRDHPRVGGE